MVKCQYFTCSSIVCLVDLTIHASDIEKKGIYLHVVHTYHNKHKGEKTYLKYILNVKWHYFWRHLQINT